MVGTPLNTKDALTSNMSKQVTYDCSVAGREQYFFTDLPKGPKNPTLVPEFFLFLPRPYETAHSSLRGSFGTVLCGEKSRKTSGTKVEESCV